jgi:hypothetical protein
VNYDKYMRNQFLEMKTYSFFFKNIHFENIEVYITRRFIFKNIIFEVLDGVAKYIFF